MNRTVHGVAISNPILGLSYSTDEALIDEASLIGGASSSIVILSVSQDGESTEALA
jgi:hypothetical protein